jgi:hypothetical protein
MLTHYKAHIGTTVPYNADDSTKTKSNRVARTSFPPAFSDNPLVESAIVFDREKYASPNEVVAFPDMKE